MAMERWSKVPQIKILAHNNYPRTATISFLIQQLQIVSYKSHLFPGNKPILPFCHNQGLYLHHNFVVALLNDLFGIQTRGGCGCAGPYSQSLLGIDSSLAHKYKDLLLADDHKFCVDSHRCAKHEIESPCEIFKPGFVRVSISFCSPKKDIEYVIEAVEFVARRGFMLLPYYDCSVTTGVYHAKNVSSILSSGKWNSLTYPVSLQVTERHKLKAAVFDSEGLNFKNEITKSDLSDCPNYDACLQDAENIVNNVSDVMHSEIQIENSFHRFMFCFRHVARCLWQISLKNSTRNFDGLCIKKKQWT